jgi:hypothetical protein
MKLHFTNSWRVLTCKRSMYAELFSVWYTTEGSKLTHHGCGIVIFNFHFSMEWEGR